MLQTGPWYCALCASCGKWGKYPNLRPRFTSHLKKRQSHSEVEMLDEFPFNDVWKSDGMVRGLHDMVRMNQYVSNWPVVLDALRRLWETGKVSQLKSSFYELVKKPKIH